MKNKVFILLLTLFCINGIGAQSMKEKKFQNAVNEIISAYDKKNSDKIDSFIHPEFGIYLFATPGPSPYWYNGKNLPIGVDSKIDYYVPEPVNQILKGQRLSTHFKLEYSKYPTIHCETASKQGLFVDTTRIWREFSEMIKTRIDIEKEDCDIERAKKMSELYKKIYNMEENTRKVILVSEEYDYSKVNSYQMSYIFIFYVTYLDNNWYLTAMDFADCPLTWEFED